MPIADVFQSNIFTTKSLTDAINRLPFKPSRIGQMGLFESRGVSTTSVVIEERDGQLQLLPTKQRGAPSSLGTAPKRRARPFLIPHVPHDEAVLASDVQDVRAFGSEDQLKPVSQLVNDRLLAMRQNHEVTHEHLRIGAIRGVILDADGTTVLFDLFEEFGKTEVEVDFELDVDATKVKAKCHEVTRKIEEALGAAPYDHIHAFVGANFWDDLVNHPTVEKAYERWSDGAFLRTDQRSGFEFSRIIFEEYRGKVGDVDFIDADQARFFPVGVPQLFRHYNAPADFMETVNTIGQPVYAKSERMEFDRGSKLHSQSNPLPLCTRPEVLVKGIK